MSRNTPPEYVRTCRRSWALSQTDVAFLIGVASRSQVSRYERLHVMPPTTVVFALCCIFGEDPAILFPNVYEYIEEEVLARAAQLYEVLQGQEGKVVKRKLDCLESMLDRACQRNIDMEV